MSEIKRYHNDNHAIWDDFVENSKNGTFLLKRGYMDYHSDRFEDHSLMFFDNKGRLTALLPANVRIDDDGNKRLYSHQGLTYGGFILSVKASAEMVLNIFNDTLKYLRTNRFTSLYYKQIPTCYHLCPSEEDEYALWRNHAQLKVCNISATVSLNGTFLKPSFERRRKRGITRAKEAGYIIKKSEEPDVFWPIMTNNLEEKYQAKPVHSLEEMKLLMQRFPDNISCYLAIKDGKAEAGGIFYQTKQTVHVQYAHATHKGKDEGALDLLYSELIDKYTSEGFHYFDIGTSNEDGGKILNTNLIAQKEGFGGRGTAYKQWEITIKD